MKPQGNPYTKKYEPSDKIEDNKEPANMFAGRLFRFWQHLFPESTKPGTKSLIESLIEKHVTLIPNGGSGGKDDPDLVTRSDEEWEDSEEPIRILLVSHGGPIKTLLPLLVSHKHYAGPPPDSKGLKIHK